MAIDAKIHRLRINVTNGIPTLVGSITFSGGGDRSSNTRTFTRLLLFRDANRTETNGSYAVISSNNFKTLSGSDHRGDRFTINGTYDFILRVPNDNEQTYNNLATPLVNGQILYARLIVNDWSNDTVKYTQDFEYTIGETYSTPTPVLTIRDIVISSRGKYRIRGHAKNIESGQRLRVIFLTRGSGGNVVSNFFITFDNTGEFDFNYTGDIPRTGTLAQLLGNGSGTYTNISMYVVNSGSTNEQSNLYFDNHSHQIIHRLPTPHLTITDFFVTSNGKYRIRGSASNVLSGERLRVIFLTRGSGGPVVSNFFIPLNDKYDYDFDLTGDVPRSGTLAELLGDGTGSYTNISMYIVPATTTTEISNLYFDNTNHRLHAALPEIAITTKQGNPFVRVNTTASSNTFTAGTTQVPIELQYGNIPNENCIIDVELFKLVGTGSITSINKTFQIAKNSNNSSITFDLFSTGDLVYEVKATLKVRNTNTNAADAWCSDIFTARIGSFSSFRDIDVGQISGPKMWQEIQYNGEDINLEFSYKRSGNNTTIHGLQPVIYALQIDYPANFVYPTDFTGFLPTGTTIDTDFIGSRNVSSTTRSREVANGHNLQDLPAGDYLILMKFASPTELSGNGDLANLQDNPTDFNANRRWKTIPVPTGFDSVTYGQTAVIIRVVRGSILSSDVELTINIPDRVSESQTPAVFATATATSTVDGDISNKVTWRDISIPAVPILNPTLELSNLVPSPRQYGHAAFRRYVYEATVSDSIGTTKTATKTFFVLPIDTHPPVITITNPTTDNAVLILNNDLGSITATALDDIEGNISGRITWQDTTDPSSKISDPELRLNKLKPNVYTYTATVKDTAGNTTTKSITFTIKWLDVPEIIVESPLSHGDYLLDHDIILKAKATAYSATDGTPTDISSKIIWTDHDALVITSPYKYNTDDDTKLTRSIQASVTHNNKTTTVTIWLFFPHRKVKIADHRVDKFVKGVESFGGFFVGRLFGANYEYGEPWAFRLYLDGNLILQTNDPDDLHFQNQLYGASGHGFELTPFAISDLHKTSEYFYNVPENERGENWYNFLETYGSLYNPNAGETELDYQFHPSRSLGTFGHLADQYNLNEGTHNIKVEIYQGGRINSIKYGTATKITKLVGSGEHDFHITIPDWYGDEIRSLVKRIIFTYIKPSYAPDEPVIISMAAINFHSPFRSDPTLTSGEYDRQWNAQMVLKDEDDNTFVPFYASNLGNITPSGYQIGKGLGIYAAVFLNLPKNKRYTVWATMTDNPRNAGGVPIFSGGYNPPVTIKESIVIGIPQTDIEPPKIIIHSPRNGQAIKSNGSEQVPLIATYTDNSDSTGSLKIEWFNITDPENAFKVYALYDDTAQLTSATTGDLTDAETARIDYLEGFDYNLQAWAIGHYKLQARVRDKSGNVGISEVEFDVFEADTIPPEITFSGLNDGDEIFAGGEDVYLSATAFDSGDLQRLPITWFDISDTAKPFETEILKLNDLKSGNYVYQARATDSSGNAASKEIRFTVVHVDEKPPSISIRYPLPDTDIRKNDTFRLSAIAYDSVDGDVSNRITWSDITNPLRPVGLDVVQRIDRVGQYTFRATVTDIAGNAAYQDTTFRINSRRDLTVPNLVITSPANNQVVPFGTPLILEAAAIDNRDGDISNLVEWSDNTLNTPIIDPANYTPAVGNHVIQATVTDESGNRATTTVLIVVKDQEQPLVQIFEPYPARRFAVGEEIQLRGYAIDNVDGLISEKIEWVIEGSDPHVGSQGETSFLNVGNYPITAKVTDLAGHTSETTVFVKVGTFFESEQARINFINIVGGLDGEFTYNQVVDGMNLDRIFTKAAFGNKVPDAVKNPTDFHAFLVASDLRTARRLTLQLDPEYYDSDDLRERADWLLEISGEIARAVNGSGKFQKKTIAKVLKGIQDKRGTFN